MREVIINLENELMSLNSVIDSKTKTFNESSDEWKETEEGIALDVQIDNLEKCFRDLDEVIHELKVNF